MPFHDCRETEIGSWQVTFTAASKSLKVVKPVESKKTTSWQQGSSGSNSSLAAQEAG